MYNALLARLTTTFRIAVWIGGSMMLFAAFMVSVDVLCRKFFGISLAGSDEISGYLFAISTAFAFPFALLQKANVRIDVGYQMLPRIGRALLDIFGLALLTFFVVIVTWRALLMVSVTWENNSHSITPLHTPLIIPQGLWVLGWCLFCFTLFVVLFGMISALVRGQFDRLHALGGATSMEEEINEETSGLLNDPSINERKQ